MAKVEVKHLPQQEKIKWIKSQVRGELLRERKLSLKLKRKTYFSCVKSAML